MRGLTFLGFAAIGGIGFTTTTPKAEAQVSVDIGVAPECPYGYYDVAPYNCTPTGYYGPEWFSGNVFIGAGPWFHGASEFQGHVNNHFHPEHGYKGQLPQRGEKAEPAKRVDGAHFKGNEVRDGRGHVSGGKRQPSRNAQYGPLSLGLALDFRQASGGTSPGCGSNEQPGLLFKCGGVGEDASQLGTGNAGLYTAVRNNGPT